jgi:hypothetical protein
LPGLASSREDRRRRAPDRRFVMEFQTRQWADPGQAEAMCAPARRRDA